MMFEFGKCAQESYYFTPIFRTHLYKKSHAHITTLRRQNLSICTYHLCGSKLTKAREIHTKQHKISGNRIHTLTNKETAQTNINFMAQNLKIYQYNLFYSPTNPQPTIYKLSDAHFYTKKLYTDISILRHE